MKEFSYSQRVYYEDTDAAGVMYHANYLKFAERGRTEWLRSLGYNQSQLVDSDKVVFPVTKVEVDFLAPAKLDDLLVIKTQVIELKKVSMCFEQTIFRNEKKLAFLKVQVVCSILDKKLVRWPPSIYSSIKECLDES